MGAFRGVGLRRERGLHTAGHAETVKTVRSGGFLDFAAANAGGADPNALGGAFHHRTRSEEHTSELQSRLHLVCRLLLEKKKKSQETLEDNFLLIVLGQIAWI